MPTPTTTSARVNSLPTTDLREDRVALLRKALAEATGTFMLVFAGCGAMMVDALRRALCGIRFS